MAIFRPAAILSPTWNYPPASPQNPASPGTDIPVATIFSSFNRLTLKVYATLPGYLTLTVPYSPQWHAFIGSQEQKIRPTDRNELAIFIPAGADEVDLRFYSRAAFIGMLISCVSIFFVLIFFARNSESPRLRRVIVTGATIMVVGGFIYWNHSLYHGDDLGMQFRTPLVSR